MQPYSPERRTALVLCGTGAHGAYHAGLLRALQEAGVKVDVMAGQGIGAAAAALAAIDGAARLWDADSLWRSARAARLYRRGWVAGSGGLRRVRARAWWHKAAGAPVDARSARNAFADDIWQVLRGATNVERPASPALSRRYSEVLVENLGQPGFRELMLIATDLDSRRDVVAALLKEPHRRTFVAPRDDRERQSEALDLAGTGREHVFDLVAASLTPAVCSEPHLMTFASDSYWRGESHRLCDRPAALSRLLEELAAAGVSQLVIVSAVPAPPSPHRLPPVRLALRHRLGEFLCAEESAALRDAVELARLRFDCVFVIRPAHNPVGPFDMSGAYDETSDRHQSLVELMQGAYEDAYRQFIEPVVGGSGEHLSSQKAQGRSQKSQHIGTF
jgi:hypothetical protein